MIYDIIIVGGGAAGLRTSIQAKKCNPKLSILVLEKYEKTGGRMETIHTTVKGRKIKYDSGAGRIHSSHTTLLGLLKQYNLHTYPLTHPVEWRVSGDTTTSENPFTEIWTTLCQLFTDLPEDEKRTKTLRQIAIEVLGPKAAIELLDKYPYRAELEIANADSSIDLYAGLSKGQFYVIAEGFSALAEAMEKEARKLNVQFKFNTDVMRFTQNQSTLVYTVRTSKGEFETKRLILAVPSKALEYIHPFSPDHPMVKQVQMEPLMRIYSVYPTGDWFPENPVVTNTPLRYIIPIDPKQGLIMSSYLDSRDIDLWKDLHKKDNNDKLVQKIQNETKTLFPELTIPEPYYTKAHLWKDGCSYWVPTTEDYRVLSQQALTPMASTYPNLHVIGESYSTKQQWVEGALEHADALITSIKENLTTE